MSSTTRILFIATRSAPSLAIITDLKMPGISGVDLLRKGKTAGVTASFGVAGFHGRDFGEFSALVHKADQMLYEAKRAGRNLVKVSFP
jgi:diguanylate cyclase (GGDEF)-like protein